MELTSLNMSRESLKANVTKLEQFETPSSLELKLQLNGISALRDKIELLRKEYYNLSSDVDLTEADRELELLEDRLYKAEVRFHFLLSKLDNVLTNVSQCRKLFEKKIKFCLETQIDKLV
ncbi:uncharacterized protein TNIN_288431 [Trichonephila inaurata madagascariensis]|uniref:Uncharacterized protein n=1 Tax=Trichonephila inaurata madagascariensis TaxID=2747483 RepID=A0A8X6XC93_9ARAC|nr:uncharacterized protein TNIN_288431 [Trichonephila inaurata madagascariensis]